MAAARPFTPMELEETLFGQLWDGMARVEDFVDLARPEDFSSSATRRLWLDLLAYGNSGPTDFARMAHDGLLPRERSDYLTACASRLVTITPGTLRQLWVRARKDHRVREALARAARDAARDGADIQAVVTALGPELDAIVRDDEKVTDNLARHCDAAIAARRDEKPTLAYPWPGWSAKYGRIREGELYGVVGETGRGKTTLLANMIAFWVHARRERVAVFTTETEGHRYLALLASIQSALPLEDGDPEAFADAINDLWRPLQADDRLIINAYARPTAAMLLAQMRRYRARGVRVFVVDHGHQVDLGRDVESWEALEQFAGELHAFAQNDSATVWVAWQPRKAPSGAKNPGGHLTVDAIKGGQLIAALSARLFNPFQRTLKLTVEETATEERMIAAGELCEFLVACLKDRERGPHLKASRLHLDATTKRLTDKNGAPFAVGQAP